MDLLACPYRLVPDNGAGAPEVLKAQAITTPRGPALTLSGDGYLVFDTPTFTQFEIEGELCLTDGIGCAIAAGVPEHLPSDTPGQDVGCLAVNVENSWGEVRLKIMPADATFMRRRHSVEKDEARRPTAFRWSADGRGAYEVGFGNHESLRFHAFSHVAGRLGVRVWQKASVTLSKLSVKVPAPPARRAPGRGGVDLLVATVCRFSDPRFGDLSGAGKDGEAVLGAFRRAHGERLDAVVFRDDDVREDVLRQALASRFQRSTAEDVLVIYVASHGVHLGRGCWVLLTPEARASSPVNLKTTSVTLAALVGGAALNPHRLVLLVVDACAMTRMSGRPDSPAAGRELTQELTSWLARSPSNNIIVLAAAGAGAHENDQGGAFTQAFVEGLRGDADADGNKRVTAGELCEFVIRRTSELTGGRQKPVVSDTVQFLGDVVVAEVG